MKKAFTLIEVIISIIIISIAISAIPRVMVQTSKSTDLTIAQESILACATKLYGVYSYRWDERSGDKNGINENRDINETTTVVRVANVNGGDDELNEVIKSDGNVTGYRAGHIRVDGRNKFFTAGGEHNASLKANFTTDDNENSGYDDIDDFDGEISNLGSSDLTVGGVGNIDYKRGLTMLTTINYVSDTTDYNSITINNFEFKTTPRPSNETTNLKMIEVNATAKVLDENITFTLRGYAANIGESPLYHRRK